MGDPPLPDLSRIFSEDKTPSQRECVFGMYLLLFEDRKGWAAHPFHPFRFKNSNSHLPLRQQADRPAKVRATPNNT